MPRGFNGGPAVEYLTQCESAMEDAHHVIDQASMRCEGMVEPARRMELPYTPWGARYTDPTVNRSRFLAASMRVAVLG